MTVYKDVLTSIQETKTLASHITYLGKVRVKTEDTKLIQAIDPVIAELQSVHARMKVKSTPLRVSGPGASNAVKVLHAYCQQASGSNKPEWQILALRNGWSPPAKAV